MTEPAIAEAAEPSTARSPEPNPLRRTVELFGVGILVLAMSGLCTLMLSELYRGHIDQRWQPIYEKQFLALVGVPTAGLSAVVIVQFFRGFHGPIEFSFGPATLKGGTGPVILWILCFSSFILAMRYLWLS